MPPADKVGSFVNPAWTLAVKSRMSVWLDDLDGSSKVVHYVPLFFGVPTYSSLFLDPAANFDSQAPLCAQAVRLLPRHHWPPFFASYPLYTPTVKPLVFLPHFVFHHRRPLHFIFFFAPSTYCTRHSSPPLITLNPPQSSNMSAPATETVVAESTAAPIATVCFLPYPKAVHNCFDIMISVVLVILTLLLDREQRGQAQSVSWEGQHHREVVSLLFYYPKKWRE